jgi:stage V sporulation protein AB
VTALRYVVCVAVGLGSGLISAGGTAAFIVMLGIVQRAADKTGTKERVKLYECALGLGGLAGGCAVFWMINPRSPWLAPAVAVFALGAGVFTGCMAASLAEVLKVIPIFTRRAKTEALFWFVLALALGKMIGALAYYLIPGFYEF